MHLCSTAPSNFRTRLADSSFQDRARQEHSCAKKKRSQETAHAVAIGFHLGIFQRCDVWPHVHFLELVHHSTHRDVARPALGPADKHITSFLEDDLVSRTHLFCHTWCMNFSDTDPFIRYFSVSERSSSDDAMSSVRDRLASGCAIHDLHCSAQCQILCLHQMTSLSSCRCKNSCTPNTAAQCWDGSWRGGTFRATLGGQLELIMKAPHSRKALSCTPADHQRQEEACAQQQQHVVKLCRRTLVITPHGCQGHYLVPGLTAGTLLL